jgi:hypothetical protein
MKRRSFLQSLLGLLSLPFVAKAVQAKPVPVKAVPSRLIFCSNPGSRNDWAANQFLRSDGEWVEYVEHRIEYPGINIFKNEHNTEAAEDDQQTHVGEALPDMGEAGKEEEVR